MSLSKVDVAVLGSPRSLAGAPVTDDQNLVDWEPSESNVADMLTKIQTGPVRKRLAQMVLK